MASSLENLNYTDRPPLPSSYFASKQDYEGYLKGQGAARGAYEAEMASRFAELSLKEREVDIEGARLEVESDYMSRKLELEARGQDIELEIAKYPYDWASAHQLSTGDKLENIAWKVGGDVLGSVLGEVAEGAGSSLSDWLFN